MTSPFGERDPALLERETRPVGGREAWLLALVLLLGLGLRLLDWNQPWSGRQGDFRSAFAGGSTGGPARNFVTHGFAETLGVPYAWRVELEDGSRLYAYYPHHPTTCISLTALSMMIFGPSEWAAQLPWVLASMLALFGTWRLARLIWSPAVALVSALFFAAIPLAAHLASMQWIDSLVVALFTALVHRYVRWMRTGERRHLLWAAGYAFLGGLSEWSATFLFPGLGLHALFVFGRRRAWRPLLATLILPAGLLAGFAVHAVHLRLALPPEELAHDTESTLDWVTTLHLPLAEFVVLQWSHLGRYLTPPILSLVLAGSAWAIARGLGRRRPSREEGTLVPLALAGVLYVAVFPSRSFNHYFFFGLSMPFFGIAAALVCLRLHRAVAKAETGGRAALACLALAAFGVLAALEASARSAEVSVRLDQPATWLYLPLLVARLLPWVALAGAGIAAIRGARRAQAALALTCALGGTVAFAAWDDVRFWSTRSSERVGELVREPWMAELLADPDAAIVTTGNITMPLQFYSVAPVFIGIWSRPRLEELKRDVLRRLGEDRPVVFLYETVELAREAKSGRLPPDVMEALTELRTFLGEIVEPVRRGELEVFDLTDWVRADEGR